MEPTSALGLSEQEGAGDSFGDEDGGGPEGENINIMPDDKSHTVWGLYWVKVISEELQLWPSTYSPCVSNSNTKETPGSGLCFFNIEGTLVASVVCAGTLRRSSQFGRFDCFVKYPMNCPPVESPKCVYCDQQRNLRPKGWCGGTRHCFSLSEFWPMAIKRMRCVGCPAA